MGILYKERLEEAQNNDKVVYYDYINYKLAAGWFQGITRLDWHRPKTIKKARYDGNFLHNLPNYYFLGVPLKELLKHRLANGFCHACAVALSTCFDDFEIITCNLKNFWDYYYEQTYSKLGKFEHTFLLVTIDDKKVVIDTTFGLITDFDTYNYIFNVQDIKKIASSEIKETDIYKFILNKKYLIGPSKESELNNDEENQKYDKLIEEYMNMCKSYKNVNNEHLQDFINRCLYRTSNSTIIWHWRLPLIWSNRNEYIYPTTNMFSLTDDEFDNNLYSDREETNAYNQQVVKNYHKLESVEQPLEQSEKPEMKIRLWKRLLQLRTKKQIIRLIENEPQNL